MTFTVLNIQGLVTKHSNKLLSDELSLIFEKSDFILLTETWSNDISDIAVKGFKIIQLNRRNKRLNTKRDSGGIALYIRDKYHKYCERFKTDSDDIIWLKIDRKLFNLTYDLYLCLSYIIPSCSSREALTEISVLDRISDHIIQIANETNNNYNILLCGDLNSRTGSEQDFVIFDNDVNMDLLPDDYEADENLQRFSQDSSININGRKLLDFCKLNGLRICNGRLGMDKGIGKYTYVGYSGRSVVDYVIANHSLFDLFYTFQVCEPNILSDHCAVEFSLLSRCTISSDKSSEMRANVSVTKKYIWCDTKEDQYRDNICLEESAFSELNFHLTQVSSPHDIDSNIEKFTKVMDKICDPLFAKNVSTSNYDYNGQTKPNKQPWFDDDCHRARKTYYEELNKFRDRKTADNQRSLVNARTNFKTVLRQKRFAYDKQKTDRLIVSKNKNAKEYWKLLKVVIISNLGQRQKSA